MGTFKQLAVILAAICCSQLAKANNGGDCEKSSVDGSLHGVIMDAVTRKPVTGVTVSISSNKLQSGKEIQSDATGHFHIAKLPPGEVTLVFEKKGYKLFKRDVLAIKEGTTTRISVEVQPLPAQDGGNDIWHPFFKLLD